jgi:tetratricopeptide (TPR) repeat protein
MKNLLTCILIACSTVGFAQSQKDIAKAREKMSLYDYYGAISILDKAIKKTKTSPAPEAIDALAECYFRVGNYPLAEQTYGRLVELTNPSATARKQYGKVLIHFGRYEDAKKQFEKLGNDKEARQIIASCDTAISWIARGETAPFEVVNEGALNTEFDDWGARIVNGNLIFISNRPSRVTEGATRPFQAKSVASGSSKPVDATPLYANSHRGYDLGPVAYTANGQGVFYSCVSGSGGQKVKEVVTVKERKLIIEEASVQDGKISNVKPFDYNKPSEYSVGHPCLSPDEKVLYFVSDMPGGYGGKDIYYSLRTANAWSLPKNAGPEINTDGDEMFPTMDANGTLYFSSNGHPGYGGQDIFKAVGARNEWVSVENMHAPINSSGDDFYLMFTDDNSGYLSSDRPNGKGVGDIYSFYRITPRRPVVQPSPPPVPTVVREEPVEKVEKVEKIERVEKVEPKYFGLVREENALSPIEGALIRVLNKKTNGVIHATSISDGSFVLDLQDNTEYMISCSKEGYELTSFDFQTGNNPTRQLRLYMKHAKVILVKDNGEGSGIDYRVQIQANNSIPPDESYWIPAQQTYPQYQIVFSHNPDGFTRYTMGRFTQLKEANKLKTELRALGYHDAFVVTYVDGKRKVVSYH